MSQINLIESVNRQIFDFVRERPNRRLMPGTGHYSTPFRGTLFGASTARDVARQLRTRRVDALWLGSNPNVPDSLANILNPRCRKGHFPDFERQMNSSWFSSKRWDERGQPEEDFSPIQRPKRGWKVYAEVLARAFGSLDAVTMANCIPWGSRNTKEFVARLGTANPALLKRALEFSDQLNEQIVTALAPKVILVPLSFGRQRTIDRVHCFGVAMAQATACRDLSFQTEQGRFNVCVATCRRGTLTVPVVYLRHPASLRLSKETSRRVVKKVSNILAEFR